MKTNPVPVIRQERVIDAIESRTVLERKQSVTLDNSATPSVLNLEHFIACGSVVTITNFRDGQDCQKLWILGDGKTSISNNANIKTNTRATHLLSSNVIYEFTRLGDVWYEHNSTGGSSGSSGGGSSSPPDFSYLTDQFLVIYDAAAASLQSVTTPLTDAYIASAATWNAKVDRAGDTMTGPLLINSGAVTQALRSRTTGAINASLEYDANNRLDFLVDSTGATILKILSNSAGGGGSAFALDANTTIKFGTGLELFVPLGGNSTGIITSSQVTFSANNQTYIAFSSNEDININSKTGTKVYGFYPAGFGISGGTPAEIYGIYMPDITLGTLNWAIKTGLGIVQFGDQMRAASIGVGNSASATIAVGTLAKKIEVFDASGSSLGFIPVYATIT